MELRQQFTGGARIPRHTHTEPYAAIVLQGSYCEAGDSGRWWTQAGDVLIHRPFSSHFDCFAKNPAQVLNLPLPPGRWRTQHSFNTPDGQGRPLN